MLPWLLTNLLIPLLVALLAAALLAGIGLFFWIKQLKDTAVPKLLEAADVIHNIRDNHLHGLQEAVEAIPPAMDRQTRAFEQAMEKQTTAMVKAIDDSKREISEQRQDLRQLTAKL